MVSGGLSKARPDIQISFNSGVEKKKLEYEDTFPDDLPTIEDVKEKYGTVIWCKYTGAKVKVPSCFTASSKKSGHVDFSQFLQSDGSPLGGNIESQHVSDDGYGALDSNSIYGE